MTRIRTILSTLFALLAWQLASWFAPEDETSNCTAYAVHRFRKQGGFILIRHSHYGWWPHFYWTGDLKTFWEFSPNIPKRQRRMAPLLFRGEPKNTGDPS